MHANAEERVIFDERAHQLDKMRTNVWNTVWKTKKRAAYAVGLVKSIKNDGLLFEACFGSFQLFMSSTDGELLLTVYERLKDIQASMWKNFSSLRALVNDDRIKNEQDQYEIVLYHMRYYMGTQQEMVYKLIHYFALPMLHVLMIQLVRMIFLLYFQRDEGSMLRQLTNFTNRTTPF